MKIEPEAAVQAAFAALRAGLAAGREMHVPGLGTFGFVRTKSVTGFQKDGGIRIVPPSCAIAFDTSAARELTATPALVEGLCDRLGIEDRHAEALLRAVGTYVSEQADDAKPVYAKGLGTFARSGDSLTFEPEADLAGIVMGHYARLEPVDIPADRPGARGRNRSARRTAWTVFAVGVLLVGAGVAAWMLTPDPLVQRTEPEPQEELVVPEEADMPQQPDTLGTPEADPPTEEPPAVVVELGGYTLVVASFENAATARSVADQYRESLGGSLPVSVLEAARGDAVHHRVVVGQVPTVAAALELKTRLSAVPEDAWPVRIH